VPWGPQKTKNPSHQKKYLPIVKRIKLGDYLKNLEDGAAIESLDSDDSGTPDIFIVYKKSRKGIRELIRHLFDFNKDGKIDLVKHFKYGKLLKIETDQDYDGLVDTISEYDTKSGELKKKTQADGNTNIWKYYFKNEIRKKEVDRNSDGKPDVWVYYRNGKITRTEVDRNFKGKIIRIDGPLSADKSRSASGR